MHYHNNHNRNDKNRVEWLVMILNFYSVVYYQRDVQTF